MGFFDKLKSIFKRKSKQELLEDAFGVENAKSIIDSQKEETPEPEQYEPLNLPEGELVPFTDEILDINSRENVEKFKHNLQILISQAKAKGRIDKFMIIREDDFFPNDCEWRVLSKNTNLELENISLSYELRVARALEKNGIERFMNIRGQRKRIPRPLSSKENEVLSTLDKTEGAVLLPSRFRSTKHFTVNTPLGVTGDYNSVSTDRDYIIMDNMDKFLESGYGYSVAYHDAYLDISHESLPISQDAVVLINDANYDRIMSDKSVASQLAQRRVVRFKGDEDIAIDMILAENGVLPSRIGTRYAQYDEEIREILDSSIKNLAKAHGLFFDKSHAGELKPTGGHFSNYYDDKNRDYEEVFGQFVKFLKQKFPEQEELFSKNFKLDAQIALEIIDVLGTDAVFNAINEYNELANVKAQESLESYRQERANISPEVHDRFVSTVTLINNFYKNETFYPSYDVREKTEESIRKFFQSGTVKEQLEAAQSVWELLPTKSMEMDEASAKSGTVDMRNIVSNAITKGVSTEHVISSNVVEQQKAKESEREGDIKDE